MKLLATILSAVIALSPSACFATEPPLEPSEAPKQDGLDVVDVDFMSLGAAAEKLIEARSLRASDVTLHFDSPGGELRAMMAFASLMRHTQLGGTRITCVVDGMAASAGLYLLEVCDVRIARPGSMYLAHGVSAETSGNAEDLRKLANEMDQLTHLYAYFIASRLNISCAELERRMKGRDFWFDADEALAIGAVDFISKSAD